MVSNSKRKTLTGCEITANGVKRLTPFDTILDAIKLFDCNTLNSLVNTTQQTNIHTYNACIRE